MESKPKAQSGQAILEYILLVVMLAVTVAVIIRNTNLQIYLYWTGIARQVSSPCVDCNVPPAPDVRK